MKKRNFLFPLAIAFQILISQSLWARNSFPLFIAPPDEDLPETDVYLLSVGLGADLYARFGHTIIRVVDRKSGYEQNLNWGIFDFRDPMFAYKFFMGNLDYRLGDDSYANIINVYQYFQRPVFQQRINLTPAQKKILFKRFVWNAQAENITYRYQYFFNNCATKPRDYLDEALGGKIKQAYAGVITDKTFRDYVYTNLNRPPVIAFLLDLAMNSRIDKKISKWEEMFLPLKLEEYLAELPAYDDQGNPIVGQKLLSERRTLVVGQEFPSSPLDLYHLLGGGWLLWMIITAFMFGQAPLPSADNPEAHYEISAPHRRRAYFSLGLMTLIWAITSCIFGSLMLLAWLGSGHLDLHHSLNLLWLWPSDILLIVLAIYYMRRRQPYFNSKPGLNHLFFSGYLKAHLLCSIVFIIIAFINVADQSIKRPALTLLPLQVLMLLTILQKGLVKGDKGLEKGQEQV